MVNPRGRDLPRLRLTRADKKWLKDFVQTSTDESVIRGMATMAAYVRTLIDRREKAKKRVAQMFWKSVLKSLLEKYIVHMVVGLLLGLGGIIAYLKGIL